jgi:hypothetical protein
MGVAPAGSAPRRPLEHRGQLLVILALALLLFGTMGTLYVQSLSLPKCGGQHYVAGATVRPEEIRCRK